MSSVTEYRDRLDTVEQRISDLEQTVTRLNSIISVLETRIIASIESTNGNQFTKRVHDAIVNLQRRNVSL